MAGLGIQVRESKGDSPDEKANALWHRDLIELAGKKLLQLAVGIQAGAERERFSEKQILELLAGAFAEGRLDRARVSSNPST